MSDIPLRDCPALLLPQKQIPAVLQDVTNILQYNDGLKKRKAADAQLVTDAELATGAAEKFKVL